MSCDRFKTRLADFALGADDAELRAHLDGCASCCAELDAQRSLFASIDRGVAAMVAEKPSGDFAAHVRRRIAEDAAAPRPWFSGWLPVTAAALALVVLVGVLNIGRPPRPPQSAVVTPPAPVAPADKSREAAPPPDATRKEAPPAIVRGPRPPRGGQSAANREPEVLVPRGQMAAVMQLYSSVWSGKADGTTLLAQAVPIEMLLKPLQTPELKIPPLEIERRNEDGNPTGSSEDR